MAAGWVCAFVLLALAGRALFRTWYAPAAILPLFWALVFEGLAILAPDYRVSVGGAGAIVALTAAYVAGSVPYAGRLPLTAERPPPSRRRSTLRWVQGLNLVGWAGLLALIAYGVTVFGLAPSPAGLLKMGNRFSLARYSGQVPTVPLLVASLCFPACLLAGRLWPHRTRREARWAVVTVSTVVVLALVTGARSSVLFGGAYFIAGVMASKVQAGGRHTRLRLRTVAFALAAAIAAPLIAGLFLQVRTGFGHVDRERVNEAAALYTVGSVAGFSSWFDTANQGPSWGQETLAGPASLAGVTERAQGLYADPIAISPTATTNVYTAFRPLVADFTLPGAVAVMFLLGLASTRAYRSVLRGRARSWVWLAMAYAAILMSPIVSPFAYNNVAIVWPIAIAALWRVKLRQDAPRRIPLTA